MSDTISVLIADDNSNFANLLAGYLEKEPDMKVAGMAKDGLEAIELIQSLLPDIVILDIIMPNLDGIGVLEKLKDLELEKKPQIIMLSAVGQDVFIQKAVALGSEYYIVKPFDVDILISRVRQVYKERLKDITINAKPVKKTTSACAGPVKNFQQGFDLEIEVTNLMRQEGIPAHVSGYQYIREAIIIAVNNERVFNSVTKVLYPSVAAIFDTTPQKVERGIRVAIENAWGRKSNRKEKPTNSEFIAMLADKIRMNLKRQ
ncbi:MAG: sporulation transcription factor Spo0A [Clostridia bacterium]|nr:sporulation transcription factor Spo0A [Clostridia bacterium]